MPKDLHRLPGKAESLAPHLGHDHGPPISPMRYTCLLHVFYLLPFHRADMVPQSCIN